MAQVTFWEKPGCAGNAEQRRQLERAGHVLEIRSLLAEPWTAERLAAFFGDRPPAAWFNRASPRVKSGEIVPETLDAAAAYALLLADPLLIRRPLLESGGRRAVGFERDVIAPWLGLAEDAKVSEACARPQAADPCPLPEAAGDGLRG
ncbi:hypothetical protein EYW49_12270 [Siculibacillus lacustris]|uniref:Nitrogenase-associated protein n=1 Tax=Siculibacillus lacustris TaxID=1549641 RepID=A0A4Q9VP09_9HYPH|nr:ArsC/Spx/MgsR family protein [Siculibacillus lacustris]TBW36927.1 hypothetical protein EYW49_12270 [Siculibacillus lacustris]